MIPAERHLVEIAPDSYVIVSAVAVFDNGDRTASVETPTHDEIRTALNSILNGRVCHDRNMRAAIFNLLKIQE